MSLLLYIKPSILILYNRYGNKDKWRMFMANRMIGYCRVSTDEQNLELQEDSLARYAAEKDLELVLYTEKVTTRKNDRIELQNAMKAATSGDVFVVYKLDRLARSTKELYQLTDELQKKGVQFVSINDQLDTTTPTGKAMFGMLAVFAEFERDVIQQRTKAGLEAARKRGKLSGRPKVSDKTKRKVRALFTAGESASDIAKECDIARSTVYKILNEEN